MGRRQKDGWQLYHWPAGANTCYDMDQRSHGITGWQCDESRSLTHFLGLTQVERIIQYARAKSDKPIYRSKAIYTFEKFSTNLQETFTVLAEYDTEVPQAEQIRLLREKIMMDKADFNAAAITTLMDGNHVTFADTVARVLQYMSHFFPTGATFTQRRGSISSINVSQIAQDKRGEKFFYNGVDITEFTRRYSRDEWLKIKDL